MNDTGSNLDQQATGSPVVTDIPRHPTSSYSTVDSETDAPLPTTNIVLFILTLLTTTMAGAYMAGADLSIFSPIQSLVALGSGLSFSIPLMMILLAHEMGHYVLARRNGVDVSLPYFIPAPFPSTFIFGTFGAFIRMRTMPRSRRAMFDIGAAGPWAGLIVSVFAVVIGLKHSTVAPLDQAGGGLELGNSLLFLGLARWILGVDPNSVNINLHPLAFAGWIGFFVTTLNLLPVGQLDGGHVAYALFGRRHRTISRLFLLFCALMVFVPLTIGRSYWAGWLMWIVILIALGLGHPTTFDADTPLDRPRQVMAWATIVLFIITFMPVPLSFAPPPPQNPADKIFQVMEHNGVNANHALRYVSATATPRLL
jgi:membrane-associated protease RseP (regulator of RpoE activity)